MLDVLRWFTDAHLLDSLSDPHMLHALAVHFPIALAFLGVPLVYLCAVTNVERDTLRWITGAAYAVLAVSAYLAALVGGRAYDDLIVQSQAISNMIHIHQQMGQVVWIFAVVTMFLVALGAVRVRWFRLTMMTLAMIASLSTAGWVAVTGYYGGALVYRHGAGVSAAALPSGEAFRHHRESRFEWREEHEERDEAGAVAPLPIRPLDPAEAARVSYTRDIKPILTDHCVRCHHPGEARGRLDVTSVASLLKGGKDTGPAIIPGKPDDSPIVDYIRGRSTPRMPKGRAPLTEDQLHLIRLWISAGAKDDSTTPPASPGAAPAHPQTETTSAPTTAPSNVKPSQPATTTQPAPVPTPSAPTPAAPASPPPAKSQPPTPAPSPPAAPGTSQQHPPTTPSAPPASDRTDSVLTTVVTRGAVFT